MSSNVKSRSKKSSPHASTASSPHASTASSPHASTTSSPHVFSGDLKKKNLILRVAVPSPLRNLFDYLLPEKYTSKDIKPGIRVLVPFGKRELVGTVLEAGFTSKVDYSKLKPIQEVLDEEPLLSSKMLDLINWTSSYYHHPIGDVVSNVLPVFLRKKTVRKRKDVISEYFNQGSRVNAVIPECFNRGSKKNKIILNEQQKQAIHAIKKHLKEFKTFLLDGVTGSGKTEVYLRVIEDIMAEGKQALVLVPEINLTPQTIARFSERFPVNIAVFHSRLTQKERLLSWQMARIGRAPIIIGTRSAIFTPLKNPGIIIIDEEHDLSFKQQSGLRYSARDLALVRGKLEKIPIILGSATPSLETIFNVRKKRYMGLRLPERAGGAKFPKFYLVDMRNQKLQQGVSENLLHKIKEHLERKGQVLVFLNRRGFAPVLICHSCSWVATCRYCDARMTLHKKKNHLRCHHCGRVARIPTECPECLKENLFMLGIGTERVEEVLKEFFPKTKITRIDRDTTRKKDSLEKMFAEIHKGAPQILVGTQMLAKGHHFPKVTMSAILNVDQSLFGSDFRSEEHLAQLIIQVAGRAGREEKPGEVYLQTHNPHHPLFLNLVNGEYKSFVDNSLFERQSTMLPPYSYLALLQAEGRSQEKVSDFLSKICNKVKVKADKSLKVFGPVPAAMERKAGYFRLQLLFQSKSRNRLQKLLDDLLDIMEQTKPDYSLRWFLDVDPMELGG